MFGEYVKPTPPDLPVIPDWEPGDTPVQALINIVDTALVEPGRAVANRFVTLETDITDLTGPNGPVTAATQVAQAAKSLSEANEQYIGTGGSIINGIQSKLDNPQTPSNPSGAASALASYIGQVDTSVRQYADGRIDANTQRIDGLQASIGPQGNLLVNAEFVSLHGWGTFGTGGFVFDVNEVRRPPDGNALDGADNEGTWLFATSNSPAGSQAVLEQTIPVEYGKYYFCSAYFLTTGSMEVSVSCEFLYPDGTTGVSGSYAGTALEGAIPAGPKTILGAYKRRGVLSKVASAPNSTQLRIRIVGRLEALGEVLLHIVRPMISEATAGQTAPTPWSPGRDPDLFAAIKETATVRVSSSGGTGPDEAGATYVFKVRAGTRYSNAQGGFGISALQDRPGSGQYKTDFRIFADRFAIMQNSLEGTPGNADHPFVVTGGAVYIRQAFIKDADITTLKLANNSVNVSAETWSLTGQTTGSGSCVGYTGDVLFNVPANASSMTAFGTVELLWNSGNAPYAGANLRATLQRQYVDIGTGATSIVGCGTDNAGYCRSTFPFFCQAYPGGAGNNVRFRIKISATVSGGGGHKELRIPAGIKAVFNLYQR